MRPQPLQMCFIHTYVFQTHEKGFVYVFGHINIVRNVLVMMANSKTYTCLKGLLHVAIPGYILINK